MSGLFPWFEAGGRIMYVILALLPCLLVSGFVHLVTAKRLTALLTFLFLTATVALGVWASRHRADQIRAIWGLMKPEERAVVLLHAADEASRPVVVAFSSAAVGLMLFAAGELRRASRRTSQNGSTLTR